MVRVRASSLAWILGCLTWIAASVGHAGTLSVSFVLDSGSFSFGSPSTSPTQARSAGARGQLFLFGVDEAGVATVESVRGAIILVATGNQLTRDGTSLAGRAQLLLLPAATGTFGSSGLQIGPGGVHAALDLESGHGRVSNVVRNQSVFNARVSSLSMSGSASIRVLAGLLTGRDQYGRSLTVRLDLSGREVARVFADEPPHEMQLALAVLLAMLVTFTSWAGRVRVTAAGRSSTAG